MKRIKRAVAVLLAVMMVFSVIGCGGCLLYTSDAADD